MPDWTDESKAALVKAYTDRNPTPETSTEIIDEIIKDLDGVTVNGARMILVKAQVYVKKTPETTAKASTASGEKKESKADSLARLTTAIEAQGCEADDTVISKLTGKAAAYFADVIQKITED